jgi:hypothetical protein
VAVARGSAVWARRGILAAVLIAAAVVPGRAASVTRADCPGPHCVRPVGTIRWTRRLPGPWVAQAGTQGTVPAAGQAYAAAGGGLAAVGFGDTVAAYRLTDGAPLWTASLDGFPAGSSVVSVRAWDGVVTAGLSVPGAAAGASHRDEAVLSAGTGQLIRVYRAAAYGGAVAADSAGVVIVGTTAVTSYANATGRVRWRVPTGPVPQAWRVAGPYLFVTVAQDGYLGTAPVTALLRIDLRTGDQTTLHLTGRQPFDGELSGAAGNVVLFSGPDGLTAYSGTDGRLLWQRAGAVLEAVDTVRHTVYVSGGSTLVGLSPLTGKVVVSAAGLGGVGLYAVSNGVALGLDEGALGDAYGYRVAARRVVWSAKTVPWPHFFVDLSGLGGSVGPAGSSIILAACTRLGPSDADGTAPCLRPELVAVGP